LKIGSRIAIDKTTLIRSLSIIAIAFLNYWPHTLQAKSFCGDEECYGCCTNNCDSISLYKGDTGKNLALAIKSCKRGCSIIHWNASGMSGKPSSKAQKVLNESCTGKDIPYPSYCIGALNLWGGNCGKAKKTDKPNKSATNKSDIDDRFNRFERSTKEDIARDLISSAFPDLAEKKLKELIERYLTRGVSFDYLTTPLRFAQEMQQIINRMRRVEHMHPVNNLGTFEGILSTVESEIVVRSSSEIATRPRAKPQLPPAPGNRYNNSNYICLPSQPLGTCAAYYQCTPSNSSSTDMYYHTSNGGDFHGNFKDPASVEAAIKRAGQSCGMK